MSTAPDPNVHEQASARLRRHEHRYTAGRRRLVDVLATAARPLTLPEILDHDPDLPQSSVYRNLEVLERGEVIRRMATGGDHAHFELAEPLIDHHHHLICMRCGTIADVHLDGEVERLVDSALDTAAEAADFSPHHHTVDLHGTCATCRATEA